jgi:hypothetical protein
LLLDAGLLERDEAAGRLSRRLSTGASAPAAAAWVDGFLTGEALLLVTDDALLAIIDEWLAGAPDAVFEDLLPLVRRTFSRYESAERRLIGQHLKALGTGGSVPGTDASASVDLERAAPAVATVARLLGLETGGVR